MSANEINDQVIQDLHDVERAVRVHHAKMKRLVRLGLANEIGAISAEGQRVLDQALGREVRKPKPAKKSADLNRCACSEDCEATSRNLFAPGHDARWAGIMGRWVAANHASDPEDTIRRMAPVGASEALIAKAVRVAVNAQTKGRK